MVERCFKERCRRPYRVRGIDQDHIVTAGVRLLDQPDTVTDHQVNFLIVIGTGDPGYVLPADANDLFIDLYLACQFNFAVIDHFAQGAAIATTDAG